MDVDVNRGAVFTGKYKVISVQAVIKAELLNQGGRVPREPGFREIWVGVLLGSHRHSRSLGRSTLHPCRPQGRLSALPKA